MIRDWAQLPLRNTEWERTFADELKSVKEDAPSPAFVARTLGILKAELDSWNEGQEMDSQMPGHEFVSSYFTPEKLVEILTKKLHEAGWEGSLEAYIDYAASLIGWRKLIRRYGDLALYSQLGSDYAYQSDHKSFYMRDREIRKKVADDIESLGDEIKAVSEAVGRLINS